MHHFIVFPNHSTHEHWCKDLLLSFRSNISPPLPNTTQTYVYNTQSRPDPVNCFLNIATTPHSMFFHYQNETRSANQHLSGSNVCVGSYLIYHTRKKTLRHLVLFLIGFLVFKSFSLGDSFFILCNECLCCPTLLEETSGAILNVPHVQCYWFLSFLNRLHCLCCWWYFNCCSFPSQCSGITYHRQGNRVNRLSRLGTISNQMYMCYHQSFTSQYHRTICSIRSGMSPEKIIQ